MRKLLLLPCLLASLFTACFREPVYPTLLTEADSAFVSGDYAEADSLLALYDSQTPQTGKQEATATAVGNYRLLLDLEQRFVRGDITEHDFSAADSLCRYYNHRGTNEKHARTLLFLGDAYKLTDYPSALSCYLQAERLGQQTHSTILQMWALRAIGDIYFDQRMLDDCKSYYRRYYQLAKERRDTLRMIHGSQRMGKVYTIENNVDSTLYYYRQGIAMGQSLPQGKDLVPYLEENLSDIYSQIEEYEKAAQLMKRDSANMFNWASWHYGQHQLDSAIYYFRKSSNLYDLQVRTECLEELAKLYSEKGDYRQSNLYYLQLRLAEDSLRLLSQEDNTRRTNAQYNYNLLKQERDELAKDQQRTKLLFIGLSLLGILSAFFVYLAVKRFRERKEAEIVRIRLQKQADEDIIKQSLSQIEKNKKHIEELEASLSEAQDRNDELEAKRLRAAAELLALKNQQIENSHRQEELKLEEFAKTDLYRKLKPSDGSRPARLSEADWIQLGHTIDDIYNNFTSRLTAMAKLSTNDLKLCYLTKLNVPPSNMADLLFLSKSAISLARRRMWTKLKGEEGTSAQLDAFIKSF